MSLEVLVAMGIAMRRLLGCASCWRGPVLTIFIYGPSEPWCAAAGSWLFFFFFMLVAQADC